MPVYNVNLVFHGVFAFILNPDGIDVVCPYIAAHSYLFGCWNSFVPLGKGVLEVEGLTGSAGSAPNPDFDEEHNPTVSGFTELDSSSVFSRVKLKAHPLGVHMFRKYGKPPDPDAKDGSLISRFPFTGLHGAKLNPSTLSGPVAFAYEADSLDGVQVMFMGRALPFHRELDPSHPNTLNLHFFAEGVGDIPLTTDRDYRYRVGMHYSHSWTELVKTVRGLDIRLDTLWPFVEGPGASAPPDSGVTGLPWFHLLELEELQSLAPGTPGGPTSDVKFGGSEDCQKAHLVVDNRA